MKHITIKIYYPQSNGPAETFNRAIDTRLGHCVAEYQRNWDIFVEFLAYVYNVHYSGVQTNHSPAIYWDVNHLHIHF